MKKYLICLLFIFVSYVGFSQKVLSYQAVILDPAKIEIPGQDITGQPLVNGDVWLKFSIFNGSSLQFEEVQKTKTDNYGLVNLLIGSEASTSFNALVWDSSQKSLQVFVSFNQGATYTKVSDQKLNYNPYALYAETAGKLSGVLSVANGGTSATTAVGARANLGLDQVNNTSDAAKPVSSATQTALNLKANAADVTAGLSLKANLSDVNSSLALKANESDMSAALAAKSDTGTIKTFVVNQVAAATIPDADATIKGKIQLAGDLGGTADAPTVPGLALKANSANVTSALALKADAANVSTSLNLKENIANKSLNVYTDGASDTKYPSVKAIKNYVDSQVVAGVSTATITDADATTKGKIKLAGDLGGTADAPTVPGLTLKANAADLATLTTKINSVTASITSEVATARAAELLLTNNVSANTASITTNVNALNLKANIASPTFTGTVTAPVYSSTPITLTYSGSAINWDPSQGLNAEIVLSTNSSLSFLTIPPVGSYGTVVLTQDGTGSRTISLPSINGVTNQVLGSSSTSTVALSAAANSKDILNFYFDGTNCYWNIGQGYGTASMSNSTNLASGVSGTLAVVNGGTGAATKAAAFDALSPMTTAGDLIYGSTSGTGTRLSKGTDGQVLQLTSGLPTWQNGFIKDVEKVNFGSNTGYFNQANFTTALGAYAGQQNQGINATAIGRNAGNSDQGERTVAIGVVAGESSQGNEAIAIGNGAGKTNQGVAAIAIGLGAGYTSQHANSIVINSTGVNLNTSNNSALYIAPIRNAASTNVLQYNTTTKEVTTSSFVAGTDYQAPITLTTTGSGSATLSGTTLNIPSIPSSVNASSISGTISIVNGGTGATSANSAFNALAPTQTSNAGKYLTTDGTNTSWGLVASTLPTTVNTSANYNIVMATGSNASLVTGTGNGGNQATLNPYTGKMNVSGLTAQGYGITSPIYASTPQVLSDGATIDWNPLNGLNASVTLSGNRTLRFSDTIIPGSTGSLVITQDITGGRTLTLPSVTNKILGSTSTTTISLSTAPNAKDIIDFYYDGSTYFWSVSQGYGMTSTSTTNLASSVTGTLPIANGGTGQTTTAGIQSVLGLAGTKVAIGSTAGATTQGSGAIAIGGGSGNLTQGSQSVAIGYVAGQSNQGANSVAIGSNAAQSGQGTQSVAIGLAANSSANNATALGANASAPFTNSTALGFQAVTSAINTIQLGADGTNSTTAISNVKTSGTLTAGTVTYPNTHGTSGQVLSTTGSGNLTWTTPSAGSSSNSHTIGESYGGGIVVYIWEGGAHGLIAASADLGLMLWNQGDITMARADGIGAGKKNTELIISKTGYNAGTNYAAQACNEYTVTETVAGVTITYGDWYLPSKFELSKFISNKSYFTGLPSSGTYYYWSSNEDIRSGNNDRAMYVRNDGYIDQWPKNSPTTVYVRPFRIF